MFLVVVSVLGRLPCKFHGGYNGDVLVFFWEVYHEGITGHNTRKELFMLVILVLVSGRSQVIDPRKIYSNSCTCSHSCYFSCSCSCSGKVTGDSHEREL
jgi:hypothetical protein